MAASQLLAATEASLEVLTMEYGQYTVYLQNEVIKRNHEDMARWQAA